MALSKEAKERLVIALTSRKVGTEVAAAIDAPGAQAANVAAIADPSTATAEDAATAVNAILSALKAAGLMASS